MKWDVVDKTLSFAGCMTLKLTGVKIKDPEKMVMERVAEADGNYMVLARKKINVSRKKTAGRF